MASRRFDPSWPQLTPAHVACLAVDSFSGNPTRSELIEYPKLNTYTIGGENTDPFTLGKLAALAKKSWQPCGACDVTQALLPLSFCTRPTVFLENELVDVIHWKKNRIPKTKMINRRMIERHTNSHYVFFY